jgi:toxin ParE1/3/4
MKVRWSKTALVELEDIFLYIFERNRMAASSVVRRIEGLCAKLGLFPRTGHLVDEAGTRRIVVVRYPFVIFYAIDLASNEVVILHVQHTARKAGDDDPVAG